MEKIWPESEEWLNVCNVKKEEYHGGTFAGNECRRLLKNVDRLEALSPQADCVKFVTAFRSFDAVVSSCYGENLEEDFLQKIKTFSNDYLKLKINVTPKVHVVGEFCTLMGLGLSPWSEQTGESLHHDFNETWKKFKINNVNPLYAEHLLKVDV